MALNTKRICKTAMGIALFVVLSLCLQVPVFENYYLCLGYVVMTVFCYYYGPLSGTAVGVLGVVLYCLLTSGLRGMPGWALGNLVIGIGVGMACKFTRTMKKQMFRHILIGISIVVFVAAAMLGVKSIVESILYTQPMLLRIAKNTYAFVADAVVMIVSLPICVGLNRPICVKSDRLDMIEDVGSVSGFVEFLTTSSDPSNRNFEHSNEWAANRGWSRRKTSPKRKL